MNGDPLRIDWHWQPHTDTLTRVQTQPNKPKIYEENHELRKNPDAVRDLEWGRFVARIPFDDWTAAMRNGYDLQSKDPKTAERELMRYLRSDEGKLAMIRGRL